MSIETSSTDVQSNTRSSKLNSKPSSGTESWKIQWQEIDQGKEICILDFDMPGQRVNKLDLETMDELRGLMDEFEKREPAAILIRSLKEGQFIAGADVKLIESLNSPEEASEKARLGQEVFTRLAALKGLKVVAINGPAMGGGLELSLACDAILVADDDRVKLALPEVQLGVLPGFGGTQRLPRKIGLVRSLDLILTGKNVPAKKAKKLNLADEMLPKESFHERAFEWTKERVKKGGFKHQAGLKTSERFLEKTALGRWIVFSQARKKVMSQTKGQYPAPLKILEVLKKTAPYKESNLGEGLEIEAKSFGELAASKISKNLIHIFFLMEKTKKETGLKDPSQEKEIQPREVKHAGVLGAGTMGGGIAWLFSKKDISVEMKDIQKEALESGMKAARKVYKHSLKRKKITAQEMERKIGLIHPTLKYEDFRAADLIVEAVVEKMSVKQQVISDLEEVVSKEAIIASNTSSLSLSEMAKEAKHPERVAGMHFFNPVHRMPLVEIIRGEKTDEKTTRTLVDITKKLGKTPVVVNDGPGFLVNRILGPYLNEAGFLLEEGVDIKACDRALLNFGMPMGPYRLIDEVGIDVAVKVSDILHKELGAYMIPSPSIAKVVEAGRLGKKGDLGFYTYGSDPKEKPEVDEKIYGVVGISKSHDISGKHEESKLVDRCILPMINEACRCLENNITKDCGDIDIGMIFGTGFPPFRGGLMRYADSLGAQEVLNRLEKLESEFGERFSPSSWLKRVAKEGISFYESPEKFA
jgi:3-hydroxyacyl-CoA dehydrogenase/enoyl-CoA hydratase/3-hydroxybutyryl-CoA epimerase